MKKPPPSQLSVFFAPFSVAVFLFFSFFIIPAQSQNEMLGLSLCVDAGMLIPNDKQASFYDGRSGPNTIDRVLYSQAYGPDIWQRLKDGGFITDAVGSYNNLQVVEWPSMYYKNAFQFGFGLRYGYNGGWGWLLRVNFARMTAAGEWLLSSDNGTGIMSDRGRYVRCGMMGVENRIIIDLALVKQFFIDDHWSLDAEAGVSFNNTKVKEHQMEIAGSNYSILDIWDGATPDYGTGSYEYMNQGGLGYGGFGSLAASYTIPNYGSLSVGYMCYYTQTHFPDFNDDDAFAPQHVIFVRATIYNFLF